LVVTRAVACRKRRLGTRRIQKKEATVQATPSRKDKNPHQ